MIITIVILQVPINDRKLSILVLYLYLRVLLDGLALVLAQHSLEGFYLVVVPSGFVLTEEFFFEVVVDVLSYWLFIEVQVYLGRAWHFAVAEDPEDGSFDSPAGIDELVLHRIAENRRIFLHPIRHHLHVHLKLPQLQIRCDFSILNVGGEILRS